MFLPEYGKSLAFIGFARPQQGGVPTISELQSRYFALLCSNKRALPSRREMNRVSKEEKKYWEKEFYITPHVLSLVNYCHYMESLAKLIGCAPKIP